MSSSSPETPISFPCPACGYDGAGATQPDGSMACPSCGELWEQAPAKTPARETTTTALPQRGGLDLYGSELIGELSSGEREGAPLESSKVRSTQEEDAGGAEKTPTKVRRANRRAAALHVGWDSDQPEAKPTRVRRSRWRRFRAKAVKALAAAAGFALVCLLVYAAVVASRRSEGGVAPAPPFDPNTPIGLEVLSSETRDAVIAQIEPVWKSFLAAESLTEQLEHVYEPERVRPLMEEHHRFSPVAPIATLEPPRGQRYRSRATLAMTNLLLPDYSVRPIAVRRVAPGEFKVDWESFVGYCEVPWAEMAETRPTEPFLVRAMVSLGSSNSEHFDRKLYRGWRLESRDGAQHISGFTLRGSESETEIGIGLKGKAARPMPITVRVAFPADSDPAAAPHAEIVEVLTLGWLPEGRMEEDSPEL